MYLPLDKCSLVWWNKSMNVCFQYRLSPTKEQECQFEDTLETLDLLQESGTRTYPTQKQTSYGRNSLSLSSAKHGTAERDLHEK